MARVASYLMSILSLKPQMWLDFQGIYIEDIIDVRRPSKKQCNCKASAQGGLTIFESRLSQEPHGPWKSDRNSDVAVIYVMIYHDLLLYHNT